MTTLRTWLLVAALATLGGFAASTVLPGTDAPVGGPGLHLLVLVACYVVFEHGLQTMQVRRRADHTQTVQLTEVPLALALLSLPPVHVLWVGALVTLVTNAWRGQALVKQAFNLVLRFTECAVAVMVFVAVAPANPFSLGGWLAVVLAAACAGACGSGAVGMVITINVGRLTRDQVREMHVAAFAVPVAMSTIGYVAALALRDLGSAVAPLLVCLALACAGVRASSRLVDRHADLLSFQAWSGRLGGAHDVDGVLAEALEATGALLLARDVSAVLTGPDGTCPARFTRDPDGRLRRWTVEEVPVSAVSALTVTSATDLGAGRVLALVASDRSTSRPFDADDARLLDMVVDKTAMALRNQHLIDQLRHDALHDGLTGLANRSAVTAELSARRAAPGGTQVLWLGLHDFEDVNEALGFDLGDEVLVQLAARLTAASPADAVVARVDGDQFAVLLGAGTDAAIADGIADALAACTAEPYAVAGVPVLLRASIGTSGPVGGDADDVTALLHRADIAMRAGRRNAVRVQRYSSALETSTPDQLGLVADLQAGIPRGELRLYVQPQERLADGTVTGVEALVRWQHPTQGLVSPGVFIPLAEQTGLDEPLTDWVLHAALEAAGRWRAAGQHLTVAVNVPPRSLSDDRLRTTVAQALRQHGVPGELLVLEITEGSLLENPANAAAVLNDLTALGVRVSVDDFGTGFSSLSHLKRLPVDEIKIDRSFVSSMLDHPDDAAIVRSVVTLAENLGLSCVAEGVEDQQTYDALARLGCETAQGYLLSPPMPVDDLPAWIDDRNARAAARIPLPRRAGDVVGAPSSRLRSTC